MRQGVKKCEILSLNNRCTEAHECRSTLWFSFPTHSECDIKDLDMLYGYEWLWEGSAEQIRSLNNVIDHILNIAATVIKP
jgi:hypothetical protein